jgi:predicted nucleic acid-binding protein
MKSLTLDTGALIALERGDKRMRTVALAARTTGAALVVPSPVLTEWWRGGRSAHRQTLVLKTLSVEPPTSELARVAGEAIAATPGATPIDALVMASAAQRGDVVYTSDFDDLDRLRSYFGTVRVLRV